MKKFVVSIIVLLMLLTQFVVSQELKKQVSQQTVKIAKGQVLKSPRLERYKPLVPSSDRIMSRDHIMFRVNSSSGLSSTSSTVTIWNWTFDESIPGNGWSLSGSWQIGSPTAGPTASSNVAGTNLTGVYENNANDWLISPSIVLPSSSTYESAVLQFKEWFELESGYDYGNVLISTDGGTNYTQISQRNGSSDWTQTEVDLTSYLGQTIKLAFQLTSDGSVTYNGWFVDDIGVIAQPKVSAKILGVDLTTLNYSAFPFVYLNVNVDSAGTPLPSLDASSFKVFQDDIEQKDYFSVTPPSSGGGVRLADIVFVIDQTGSMGEEIEAVKSNMISFLDALKGSDINYRVGFIVFGDITNTLNSGNLYSDYTEILNTINSIYTGMIDMGNNTPENQLEAMYQATQMNFRTGAQKIAIMLTDAPAHVAGDGDPECSTSWTVPTLIPVLTTSNLTVYPIFDVSASDQMAQYLPIAQARNSTGVYYGIYDNFNTIINDIGTTIGETYVVRFASSDRRTSGVRHLVRVEVTHGGYTESDTASYMFGAAPVIARTPETIALATTAWAEWTAFTIRANVTDEFAPGVSSVTLYYRTTGASSFTSVPMVLSFGSLYEASIPVSSVVSPGVDYYITASDGIDIASDPREEPGTNPYQIAILPNQAPVITHVPVLLLTPGNPILIAADVFDNTNSLASIRCYYRKTGDLVYTQVDMTHASGTSYSTTIPGEVSTADGVDYYMTATDDFGLSSYDGRSGQPHQIGAFSSLGIIRIWDFPNDNGRSVWIQWRVDVPAWSNGINKFDAEYWDKQSRTWANVTQGGISATDSTVYQTNVLTEFDSTKSKGMYYSVYRIVSYSDTRVAYSVPDSGYSLDNIAPGVPSGLIVTRGTGNVVEIRWNQVEDSDLFGYSIYRSLSQNFNPDASTKVSTVSTELFVDNTASASTAYYYKITSIDHSGNESMAAQASTTTLVESDAIRPLHFSIGQNFPNPFNPSTSIRYSVPVRSSVRLVVYNTIGETVAMLENKLREPGYYTVTWQPSVASGHYYYRMEATATDGSDNNFVETKKMIILK